MVGSTASESRCPTTAAYHKGARPVSRRKPSGHWINGSPAALDRTLRWAKERRAHAGQQQRPPVPGVSLDNHDQLFCEKGPHRNLEVCCADMRTKLFVAASRQCSLPRTDANGISNISSPSSSLTWRTHCRQSSRPGWATSEPTLTQQRTRSDLHNSFTGRE